jgi:membrane-bound lytic murein transglycosylase D
MLNIPMDEIVFLNPAYKRQIIPATPENTYILRLRKKYIGNFINNEASLYVYRTKAGLASDSMAQLLASNYRESQLYTVKKGETVSSVAKKFKMTSGELKSLNGLKSNSLRSGKKILVYSNKTNVKKPMGDIASTAAPKLTGTNASAPNTGENEKTETGPVVDTENPPVANDPPKKIHQVRSGESLGSISRKYQCSVSDLKRWNNLSSDKIMVGQKLKVAATGTLASGGGTTATGSKPKTSSSGTQRYFYYTIKPGDNLWDIAEKNDVTVSQIKSLNKLKNSSRIKPGQKIKIPK